MLLLFAAASRSSLAQSTKAQLEISETFFSLAAALNSCGYDSGVDSSLPLRQAVRTEVQTAVNKSPDALQKRNAICQFWTEHQQPGKENDVTPYLSLALNLGPPPAFAPTLAEADLAPDAARVLGVASLLQKFYQSAGLHAIWEKFQDQYQALVSQLHDPISNELTHVDLYLKLPFSNYPGQRFVLYLEPLLSPAEVDARNYGSNYYMVISPDREGHVRSPEIRHTYLHFVLDPMALGHAKSLKDLEPILEDLRNAPMAQSFKNDISLLVNECLIRAIEARMLPGAGKEAEAAREQTASTAEHEGFTLTPYFYNQLVAFERSPAGVKDSYADWIYNIDLGREKKRAEQTEFAKQASPELLHTPQPRQASLLDLAEQRLSTHDAASAAKLANDALNEKQEDPARALFILARAAAASGDMQGALSYFQRTIDIAREPRMVAWSHIYLGRIMDIQEQRDAALKQYNAALAAGDSTPDTKTAAERGLAQPYAPPASAPR